jgi:hypothetical protein
MNITKLYFLNFIKNKYFMYKEKYLKFKQRGGDTLVYKVIDRKNNIDITSKIDPIYFDDDTTVENLKNAIIDYTSYIPEYSNITRINLYSDNNIELSNHRLLSEVLSKSKNKVFKFDIIFNIVQVLPKMRTGRLPEYTTVTQTLAKIASEPSTLDKVIEKLADKISIPEPIDITKNSKLPRQKVKDDMYYDGMWSYGKYNGKGRIEFTDPFDGKNYIEGEWSDNNLNGMVTYKLEFKYLIHFDLFEDLTSILGYCVKDYEYTGMFRNGKHHGIGTKKIRCIDNDIQVIYNGNYNDNMREGEGTQIIINNVDEPNYKQTYIGTWIKNVKHPNKKAIEIYETKNYKETYDGNFINNMKSGNGTFIIEEGVEKTTYNGNWENDMKNGMGKEIHETPDYEQYYDGMWRNNMREGNCTIIEKYNYDTKYYNKFEGVISEESFKGKKYIIDRFSEKIVNEEII